MKSRKQKLTDASVALNEGVRKNNNPSAVKGLRTKWENLNRAYWEAVYRARDRVLDGESFTAAADEEDVEVADLAEIANH